ncbi:hypothetical protein Ahy_B02g059673 isoform E [Arachis hypogaea]|uniref:Uncharacterized protein n=1 Tax=Arachis hypogaea TaxID=3818 RepID=A0A445AH42_ARAHY|nr:hypothetical protein Ahy_B02g059673 isoform E [Arachis hypogaea]
MDPQKKVCIE